MGGGVTEWFQKGSRSLRTAATLLFYFVVLLAFFSFRVRSAAGVCLTFPQRRRVPLAANAAPPREAMGQWAASHSAATVSLITPVRLRCPNHLPGRARRILVSIFRTGRPRTVIRDSRRADDFSPKYRLLYLAEPEIALLHDIVE